VRRNRTCLDDPLSTGAACSVCPAGGSAAYHRDGGDLQFLTTVAAAVREQRPDSLLLLTASSGVLPSARSMQ